MVSAMKHINLPLSDDFHKKLKIHCVEQDKKMTDLIRKLVEDYLEKVEQRRANK